MLQGERIVGGKDAPYPIPWQAWIGGCGATILDAKTLLSAAHCFVKNGQSPKPSLTYREIRVGSIESDYGGQVFVFFWLAKTYCYNKGFSKYIEADLGG